MVLFRCHELAYLVACGIDPHYEETLTDVRRNGQTEANLHFGKLECPMQTGGKRDKSQPSTQRYIARLRHVSHYLSHLHHSADCLKIEITGENIIPPLLQDMTYKKTEIVAREKALPRDDTPRPP